MVSYRIDVASILEALGDTVSVADSLPLEKLEVGAEQFVALEAFRFEARVTNTGGGLVAEGRIVAPVQASCARCLCDFPTAIEADISGFYVHPGCEDGVPEEQEIEYIDADGFVDLGPALAAALILEAPFAPLHAEDCKGLCPNCGEDLNEGPCDCRPLNDPGHPFAALRTLREKEDPVGGGD